MNKGSHKHDNCTMIIRRRVFKGHTHSTPGLYCCEHATHIKWLSNKDAEELIALGVLEDEKINDPYKFTVMKGQW